ncbi:MAG: MarR family winged helix-turn-helix transcriptional regulator [Schleiferiaceae bacterium]|jgi:DNA-binding MarR family transcriptional regulator
MSLEAQIKQSTFKSEQSKLIVNLIYTYNQLKGQIASHLKEEGLTMQQYNVLRIVRGAGDQGSTTSEIRERLLDKMSDASRMVDRLVAMGHLEKVRDQDDRRLVYVYLTDAGAELVERLVGEEVVESVVAGFCNEKAQQLNELLDHLRDAI